MAFSFRMFHFSFPFLPFVILPVVVLVYDKCSSLYYLHIEAKTFACNNVVGIMRASKNAILNRQGGIFYTVLIKVSMITETY